MAEKVVLAHGIGCDASAVSRQLKRHGYEIRLAHDGEALIALADSWRPQAAVIELGLKKRPALAAGSALRNRFGGEIQLVGFTVPSAPELEKHALDSGFDHVVVDVRDAAEVLLALSIQGAALVRRAQGASFNFARTMVEFAKSSLAAHARLAEPHRRRNIVLLRRAIEAIARSVEGGAIDAKQANEVGLALGDLEARFERLVRPQDGQG